MGKSFIDITDQAREDISHWNKNGDATMENLKQEANRVISALPESATIEEIMYELYVVDKVKKCQEAIKRGESQSTEELKKEMLSWEHGQSLQKNETL
ncbi:MAG: hypothetical protein ACOYOE_09835 [Chlorobium sp.]